MKRRFGSIAVILLTLMLCASASLAEGETAVFTVPCYSAPMMSEDGYVVARTRAERTILSAKLLETDIPYFYQIEVPVAELGNSQEILISNEKEDITLKKEEVRAVLSGDEGNILIVELKIPSKYKVDSIFEMYYCAVLSNGNGFPSGTYALKMCSLDEVSLLVSCIDADGNYESFSNWIFDIVPNGKPLSIELYASNSNAWITGTLTCYPLADYIAQSQP